MLNNEKHTHQTFCFNDLEIILLAKDMTCTGPEYIHKQAIETVEGCNDACEGYSKFVTYNCDGQTDGKICGCWCMDETEKECVYRDNILHYSIYKSTHSELLFVSEI